MFSTTFIPQQILVLHGVFGNKNFWPFLINMPPFINIGQKQDATLGFLDTIFQKFANGAVYITRAKNIKFSGTFINFKKNKVTNMLCQFKQFFFSTQVSSLKGQSNKLWNTLKSVFSSKRSDTHNDITSLDINKFYTIAGVNNQRSTICSK